MKVQIIEAKLHKNLEGDTLRLGIIEKMKSTKMLAWFKEWSETVYQKQPPQWFNEWNARAFEPTINGIKGDIEQLRNDFTQLKIDNNLR